MRRAFAVWLKRVLLPRRVPGAAFPEVVELQEVRTILAERVKEWTKTWVEHGIEQGREQGLQQGRQEGEAILLLRLLERKFGSVPDEVRRRVAAADSDALIIWGECVLRAETLEQVSEGKGISS